MCSWIFGNSMSERMSAKSALMPSWISHTNQGDSPATWLEARRGAIIPSLFESNFHPERLASYGIEGVDNLDREMMERTFISPLFGLLVEYIRTGKESYREVYLDERLRYAPHKASPTVRHAYFRELLQEDEAILLRGTEEGTEIKKILRAKLYEIHAPLLREPQGHPLRLLAVGDCLMNEVRVFLPSRCRAKGIEIDMQCLYFSALVGKKLSVEQVVRFLECNPVDVIALSFLTYEGLPLYRALIREAGTLSAQEVKARVGGLVSLMSGFMEDLRSHTDAPFLLHNVSGLPLTRWRKYFGLLAPFAAPRRRVLEALNMSIADLVAHTPNCVLIDEARVAQEEGYRQCQQDVVPRHIARHAMFHTSKFGAHLFPEYFDILKSFHILRRTKVLLIDFDNTLWDGVMADGPVCHHKDRQQLLRDLKESGMLLAAVSKNDPKNIRWNEMVLTPDDFVLSKISWNHKVTSIQEIAAELDLGMDSFILVDDSPEEREFVRSQFPMVATLDSHLPFTWRSLERLLQFPNTRQTEEARSRTSLYRSQAQRREALASQLDYPAMMAALGLRAKFGKAHRGDLDRLTELVQRTNQFNTTTIRYPKAKLEALMESPNHRVYVTEVSDKFGALGLVAVVVVERQREAAIIESFVMSCRAMGFGLENLLLRCVLDEEQKAPRFVGRILPTDRNGPVKYLFSEAGFAPQGAAEWVLDGNARKPSRPEWFTLEYRDPR